MIPKLALCYIVLTNNAYKLKIRLESLVWIQFQSATSKAVVKRLTLFPLGYFEDLSPLGGGADLASPSDLGN